MVCKTREVHLQCEHAMLPVLTESAHFLMLSTAAVRYVLH